MKTRKERCDKGKSRHCSNCSAFEDYALEYTIYIGGTCLITNEKVSSDDWCKHWRKR